MHSMEDVLFHLVNAPYNFTWTSVNYDNSNIMKACLIINKRLAEIIQYIIVVVSMFNNFLRKFVFLQIHNVKTTIDRMRI
jgi:hypothetical protein